MSLKERPRIAIAGSGTLAGIRARAVRDTGRADVVAVGGRRSVKAAALAQDMPGARSVELDELLGLGLDAVVVALPHHVQDAFVPRALDAGLDVLIGGPLARTAAAGRDLVQRQLESGLVVEAGYEARYESLWQRAAALVRDGALGDLVSVRSNAGFDQVDNGWYVDQGQSGGMLVTHLTYAFLDPLRWLLGEPELRGAAGNVKRATAPGAVSPETCVTVWEFPGDVVASLTASYVKPRGLDDWHVLLVGTQGALTLHPADLGQGKLELVRPGHEVVHETSPGDGFARQAARFVDAVRAPRQERSHEMAALRNPPAEALRDLEFCEQITDLLSSR